MKVETFRDVIDWTRALHHRLAECLQLCSTRSEEQRARWLMSYLADHERQLEQVVEGFEQNADPKALNTWVCDYLGHQPIDPHRACDAEFSKMTFEQISHSVFDLHNQVIELYRYLESRAEISAARDLLRQLLDMEEHETMRLAQQAARIGDL